MNKSDKVGILNLAKLFLSEYRRLRDPSNDWKDRAGYQANYDALNGFKRYGFIQDFDTEKGILLDNVWHKVRY